MLFPRVKGLSLDASGADKQQMTGSEYRAITGTDHNSILFGLAKRAHFDLGRRSKLKGEIAEVLTVTEERGSCISRQTENNWA
jgi:hypothetical protein